jgi:hypothetical protein
MRIKIVGLEHLRGGVIVGITNDPPEAGILEVRILEELKHPPAIPGESENARLFRHLATAARFDEGNGSLAIERIEKAAKMLEGAAFAIKSGSSTSIVPQP